MLKRLIIAVFGIALVVAFGSTAFAGPILDESGSLPLAKSFPNTPRASNLVAHDVRPVQPDFRKPESALRALPPGSISGASPSSIYFCDIQGYAGSLAWVFTIPDQYGDDLYNTRFTVEAGFDCTLKVAHLLAYGDSTWGTPDMRVYLWDDDGFGFPGALLDSVDIPNASLPASGGAYVSADFSASGWVFSDGAEYHYGYTVIGGAGDTLGIVSDDAAGPAAGEERSSEFYLGAWGSMLNDYGDDYVFEILSERCCSEIPFSDCYTQAYGGGAAYVWFMPDPTFGDSAYAMRFDVGGPETLASVDVRLYGGAGALGDEDVHVAIYDDAAGFPGSVITSVTLTGGTYALYPAYANVVFAPLVLEETFHVVLSSAGVPGTSYEAIVSDNGTFGTGRASASGDPGGGAGWYSSTYYGADLNWMFRANLCRDEFSDCITKNYGLFSSAVYPIPDANPIIGWAQKFEFGHGEQCQLRETFIVLYRHPADSLRPNMYTYNTEINVYDDAAGVPGSLIDQQILTPADYAAAGYTGSGYFGYLFFDLAWTTSVPPSFYVEIQSLAPTRDEGIRMLYDPDGLGGGPADGLIANAPAFGGWIPNPFFALNAAMYMDAKVCCVPFTGRPCTPPSDWATLGQNPGRTGTSQLAIEDAWCDLTVDWYWETPANTIQFNSPIVYDGRVFVATASGVGNTSNVEVFDLYDGTNIETIFTATEFSNFVLNDPLIVNDVLYIAGGDNRVISAWDVTTWGASAFMWARTLGAAVGPTRSTQLLLLNVAGTDVLFGGSQIGRVFAINASDGTNYAGWAVNPVTLDANQVVQNSASDGAQLFFGTYLAGLNGDIWSINPANGSTNWKLSAVGGRQGATIWATATAEQFPSLSYENGVVYAGSAVSGDFPADGVFYRIDASDGSLVGPATSSPRMRFNTFVVDVNLVYAPTLGRWIGGTAPYPLLAFSKLSGALVWEQEHVYEANSDGIYIGNAALTCEPEPATDIIVANDGDGILAFWNSLTGEQIFRRRWDYGAGVSAGTSASLGVDSSGTTHVLGTSFFGGVVSLTKDIDRPRLEIQDYDPNVAVEFSVSTSVIYTVDDMFVNTGCADLTFNAVNVDDATFGSTDPGIVSVRPGLQDLTNSLAKQLAWNSGFHKDVDEFDVNIDAGANLVSSVRDQSYRNERGNRAAMAFPVYLNGVVEPFATEVLPAGDTIPLVLDVNASLIERGPQTFYIELDTDDPDFFLNAASPFLANEHPELVVTLVGGCLTDTTALHFGAGGANYQWVSNTSRLADGDWSAFGFEYDGEPDGVFQGTYVFGVSTERIAMNVTNWSGQGQENSWYAVQGDPNYCDNSCKPALTTGVPLGDIWDGISAYVPITGNVVCKSWIDSVQDYGLGAGVAAWDWRNYGAPFDDTLTMGLTANTRTIGALDTDGLTNLTLEIFEITERNGDTVPDWKFAGNVDYDISPVLGGGPDTAVLDQSSSAVWTTSAANASSVHFAFGMVKIPFGCGYAPIKNAMSIDANQGHWNSTDGRGDPYWDSAYFYMSLASGTERSHVMQGSADQQWHATLVEHDFLPNETFTFGSVNFGLISGVTNPSAPGGGGEISALANLANKWAGFGRGDVNDDNAINLGDIMTLAAIVNGSIPGAIPFEHLGDVDTDNDVDNADLQYLIDYYFQCGPCPLGAWEL